VALGLLQAGREIFFFLCSSTFEPDEPKMMGLAVGQFILAKAG